MRDEWQKQDRPCPPCADCGAELYEKFWGNGGWVRTDKATDRMHDATDCVKVLRAKWDAVALSKTAHVLAVDVDDMMGALRLVASMEYDRAEVRTIAHLALKRLEERGIDPQPLRPSK